MKSIIWLAAIFALAIHQTTLADDRPAEFAKLSAEFEAAQKAYWDALPTNNPTAADKIKISEGWPGWQFIPRFVELAEAQPDDDTAFQCCMWLCDRMQNVGNRDKRSFAADQKTWELLAEHHTARTDLPATCFRAVEYYAPARERFLRELISNEKLSRENRGFATLALAAMLANKYELCVDNTAAMPVKHGDEFVEYLANRNSPELSKDLIPANAAKCKADSMELCKEVLAHYADVPVTITAPGFRSLKRLGDKAAKTLNALEHLDIGSELPNITGKDLEGRPLDLNYYRGKVVVISVWFTGCGPCMEMVPSEQRMVAANKDRPFALLGVCCDETIDAAQKTSAEQKMDWPCWFDGAGGPIATALNVLHWPMTYVLDKNGIIVAKDLRDEKLAEKVAELLDKR